MKILPIGILAAATLASGCQHLESTPCDEARAIAAAKTHRNFNAERESATEVYGVDEGKNWKIVFDIPGRDWSGYVGGPTEVWVNRRTCRPGRLIVWQ